MFLSANWDATLKIEQEFESSQRLVILSRSQHVEKITTSSSCSFVNSFGQYETSYVTRISLNLQKLRGDGLLDKEKSLSNMISFNAINNDLQ